MSKHKITTEHVILLLGFVATITGGLYHANRTDERISRHDRQLTDLMGDPMDTLQGQLLKMSKRIAVLENNSRIDMEERPNRKSASTTKPKIVEESSVGSSDATDEFEEGRRNFQREIQNVRSAETDADQSSSTCATRKTASNQTNYVNPDDPNLDGQISKKPFDLTQWLLGASTILLMLIVGLLYKCFRELKAQTLAVQGIRLDQVLETEKTNSIPHSAINFDRRKKSS